MRIRIRNTEFRQRSINKKKNIPYPPGGGDISLYDLEEREKRGLRKTGWGKRKK
jgi:hypothetical protein